MCYNIISEDGKLNENFRKSRPSFYCMGGGGAIYPLVAFFRRAGLVLGVFCVMLAAYFADGMVMGYSLEGVGADAKSGVVRTLQEAGAVAGARFSDLDLDGIGEDIVKNTPIVRFATVTKRGSFIEVQTIEQPDESKKPEIKDLLSPTEGKIIRIAVLRGTPLVKAGDKVKAGTPLVGAYFTAGESMLPTAPVAEIDIEGEFVLTLTLQDKSELFVAAAVSLAREKCPESHIIGQKTEIAETDGMFEIAVTLTFIKSIGG